MKNKDSLLSSICFIFVIISICFDFLLKGNVISQMMMWCFLGWEYFFLLFKPINKYHIEKHGGRLN